MQTNNYPDMIILGSTGSVGSQAIDVAKAQNVKINALSANKNVKLIETQARLFGVRACAMSCETSAKDLKERLADTNIKVYAGNNGICEMIETTTSQNPKGQTVLNSIVGEAGLLPTISTIKSNNTLALANKESLVVGGEIVMKLAKEYDTQILPVDSEHCAIFQCLRAGSNKEIKKLILTASGGPFYGYSKEDLSSITVERALAHPTWQMGSKITIDSSTLMNKGLEIIEAVHLFDIPPEKIQVVVHKESIIHSAVEYIDNSIIAQMSVPDMKHCVQYALTHPNRLSSQTKELDLFEVGNLSFQKPDYETFSLLRSATDAIKKGGAVPAVLNAANEEAVWAFLDRKISYLDISCIVQQTIQNLPDAINIHDLQGVLDYCKEARKIACQKILKTK